MVWLTFLKTLSSAAVFSDESAPTFSPLQPLPLVSLQSLVSLYCWFSVIPSPQPCSGFQSLVWPALKTSDSLPVSGTWPGQPFRHHGSQDPLASPGIWGEASKPRHTHSPLSVMGPHPATDRHSFRLNASGIPFSGHRDLLRKRGLPCPGAWGLACPSLFACHCPAHLPRPRLEACPSVNFPKPSSPQSTFLTLSCLPEWCRSHSPKL